MDILERLKHFNAGRTHFEGKDDIFFHAQSEIERLRAKLERADRLADISDRLSASVQNMAARLDQEPGNQTVVDLWESKIIEVDSALAAYRAEPAGGE